MKRTAASGSWNVWTNRRARMGAVIVVALVLGAACGGGNGNGGGLGGSADCRSELEGGPRSLPDAPDAEERDEFLESFPLPPDYVIRPALLTSDEGDPVVILLMDGSVEGLMGFYESELDATGFDADTTASDIEFRRGAVSGEIRIREANEPFQACSEATLTWSG